MVGICPLFDTWKEAADNGWSTAGAHIHQAGCATSRPETVWWCIAHWLSHAWQIQQQGKSSMNLKSWIDNRMQATGWMVRGF